MEFKVFDVKTNGKKIVVTDEKGNEIVRCFTYLIYNDLHPEPYALLEDVFVKEEFRNKGVGTQLVKKAIEIAKELNCYKILATSRFERENVHKFYEKLGFKKWGFEFRLNLK